jgi:soluble lytic murein transglycosylase-like protein
MAYHNIEKISEIEAKEVVTIPIEIEAVMIDEIPNLDSFLNDLGHRESSNRYDVVNQYGYMGKYQFGSSTLKGLGYNISRAEFLNSPDIQEEAIVKLLKANKKVLKRQIKKYDRQLVNGILVTESGLLAAAHLVGPGSVKKWVRNGTMFEDGNRVKLTEYIKTFNGYQLDI